MYRVRRVSGFSAVGRPAGSTPAALALGCTCAGESTAPRLRSSVGLLLLRHFAAPARTQPQAPATQPAPLQTTRQTNPPAPVDSPPRIVSALLDRASSLDLPRPGTLVAQPAVGPYRPRKPLPPRTQQIIDQQLKPLRRKEHPDWLEKNKVRKMTMQERQQLLTAQHQMWDLEKLSRHLRKAKNPLASIQFIDRAHDWFIRCYTYAPVRVFHQMLLAAGRFRQFERCDEYFKLLLQYHQPTPKTFHAYLAAHAQAGHTLKVESILGQMGGGAKDLLADKLYETPAGQIPDPTDSRIARTKRWEKNATFRFPFEEKALYYLIQTHTVNNDSQAIQAILDKLVRGDEIYPTVNGRKLQLTTPVAELLMHYFSLHRLTGSSIGLLAFIESSSLPLTPQIAWSFFDAFKREYLYRKWEREGRRDEIMREEERRQTRQPIDIDAIHAAQKQQAAEATAAARRFDPMALPSTSAMQVREDNLPAHLQRNHFLAPAIRDPFPSSVASTSSGVARAKTFPKSPIRERARNLTPSPIERMKEQRVTFGDVVELLLDQYQFVPTAPLVNAYLAYHHQQFYPAQGRFPAVMRQSVRQAETVLTKERVEQAYEKYRAALATSTEAASSSSSSSPASAPSSSSSSSSPSIRPTVDPPTALRSLAFTPFSPDGGTYAVLIQAFLDREPLKPFDVVTSVRGRVGPRARDQKAILGLRSEMRARAVQPILATKVNMMQLQVYAEKWKDLYASFTLLWKHEKMRRERKLEQVQRQQATTTDETTGGAITMEQMLREEEKEAAAGENSDKDGALDDVAAEAAADSTTPPTPQLDADGRPIIQDAELDEDEDADPTGGDQTPTSIQRAFSSLRSAQPFTCMSLLPVFLSLAQRPTLERLNLFLGIVSQAKDFPLTRAFFQHILQILSDRGESGEILQLLKVMKSKYKIEPKAQQYNSLLASMLHANQPSAAATTAAAAASSSSSSSADGVLGVKAPRPPAHTSKELITNMFQTWELMRLLHVSYTLHTLHILLLGCLKYGQVEDGRRLWHWLHWKTEWRPTVGMYTIYLEFLLKRNELAEALSVLRSQSFKDGHDWTLRQCGLVLEFFESDRLLKLAKRTGGDASSMSEGGEESANASAAYVPTPAQIALYQSIRAESSALSLELLALEKRGGKLAAPGALEVREGGQVRSNMTMDQHRQHHSPGHRAKYATLEEKEVDEVTTLSTIPRYLFPQLTRIIAQVEEFTGEKDKRKEREARSERIRLLTGGGGGSASGGAASTNGGGVGGGGGVDVQVARAKEIERLAKEASIPLPVSMPVAASTAAAPSSSSSAPTAASTNATPSVTTAPSAPAVESAPADSPAAAAASSLHNDGSLKSILSPLLDRLSRPLPPGVDPVASAKRKADRAAAKQQKRDEKATLSEEKKKQPAPASAPVFLPTTEVEKAMNLTLDKLSSEADRSKPLQSSLPTPRHPAKLGDIDLCALLAADQLASLKIVDLRAIQTSAELMAQAKDLVKGKKGHHIEVARTWLEHCECQAHKKQ